MSEGRVESCDPLEYNANDVCTLNKDLAEAFKANNREQIQNIINVGFPITADVFIAISKHSHPCILIVPAGNHSLLKYVQPVSENPFSVPDNLLCWQFDLCLEEMELKKYTLSMKINLFKILKESIEKAFFMGRYENVRSYLYFQLAILQVALYHCNAILADCDEFAKKFCICLVAYCSNSKEMETIVKESIKKVSARNFKTSRFVGNFIAEGTNVSSFLYENRLVASTVIFLMIYPVAISLFVLYIHANCI